MVSLLTCQHPPLWPQRSSAPRNRLQRRFSLAVSYFFYWKPQSMIPSRKTAPVRPEGRAPAQRLAEKGPIERHLLFWGPHVLGVPITIDLLIFSATDSTDPYKSDFIFLRSSSNLIIFSSNFEITSSWSSYPFSVSTTLDSLLVFLSFFGVLGLLGVPCLPLVGREGNLSSSADIEPILRRSSKISVLSFSAFASASLRNP